MDRNSKILSETLQNGAPSTSQVGAYNTYIGARYVPIFDGQWVNTKAYEPLTVVVNQGNSYTSRQYVPIGVDISNNEFWALTGNYNGQIASLENEINRINGEITNINNSVTNISDNVDKNTNDISQIKKDLQEGYLFLADSWGDTQQTWTGWPIRVATNMKLKNYVIKQQSGAGFIVGDRTFLGMCQELTEDQREMVTIIVLQTALNDLQQSQDSVRIALARFITWCNTNLPNLKQIVAIPCVDYFTLNYSQKSFWYSLFTENSAFVVPPYLLDFTPYGAFFYNNGHLTDGGTGFFANSIAKYLQGCSEEIVLQPASQSVGSDYINLIISSSYYHGFRWINFDGTCSISTLNENVNLIKFQPGNEMYFNSLYKPSPKFRVGEGYFQLVEVDGYLQLQTHNISPGNIDISCQFVIPYNIY